jgi:hypothetical protein
MDTTKRGVGGWKEAQRHDDFAYFFRERKKKKKKTPSTLKECYYVPIKSFHGSSPLWL